MIVGFTGTQHGLTEPQRAALEKYLRSLKGVREFHHGDCIGADAEAHEMVILRTRVVTHPSDSKNKRAYCNGAKELPAKPPLNRNVDIVLACTLLVGCPKTMHEEQRSGTWATIREAFRRGKKVTVVWPNGRVQKCTSLQDIGDEN